jgi:hypothetical protein
MASSRTPHWQQAPKLEPVMLLILATPILLWALPALLIGLIAERLLRERTWSTLLWLVLAVVGLAFTTFWLWHGLSREIVLSVHILAVQVRSHQVDLARWDIPRFWAAIWPIWLKTMGVAPLVASVRGLAALMQRRGAAFLQRQERSRQHAVARAQRQAARRLHHFHHHPDAVAGHMVIGIPIEDEANR